jgi:hypothetical protein
MTGATRWAQDAVAQNTPAAAGASAVLAIAATVGRHVALGECRGSSHGRTDNRRYSADLRHRQRDLYGRGKAEVSRRWSGLRSWPH